MKNTLAMSNRVTRSFLANGWAAVTRNLRRFGCDRKGATAVVFTISLIPVTAGLGMSVDVGRLYLTRAKLQSALDSAAIASAVNYKFTNDQTKAMAAASNVFAAATGSVGVLDIQNSSVNVANAQVNLLASAVVSTPLMGLLSPTHSSQTIKVNSQASIRSSEGLGKNLEVSLMLDVTISMGQNSGTTGMTKLAALQTAAKNLVDTVVQADQSKKTSRVSLAPFASAVNVGSYFPTINGGSIPTTTTTTGPSRNRVTVTNSWPSVVERGGAYVAIDDAPSSANFPSYYAMRSSAKGQYASYESSSTTNRPNATILPLTSDKNALKTSIDSYAPDGSTAGHIGIAWSWYLLSPKWTGVWTGAASPNPADDKTVKVVVLMSDFDFNTYYQGGVGDAASQAAQLCTNMKAAGVVVYTVGFQVNSSDSVAVGLFNNCASDPTKAIAASNGAELISVYDKIAKTVLASISQPIRLSR